MVENDINKVCDVINCHINIRYLDEFFLRLYSFTNENLKYYMDLYNFSDKKVLTTGSSCDQILNLISYGCKDISSFDINPFVKYFYELKKAAIISLPIDKYLDFFHGYREKNNFFSDKIRVLDYDVYNNISKYMNDDSKAFWDFIFNKYSSITVKKNLFMREQERSKGDIIHNNNYLKNDCYLNLRNQFDKVNIIFYHDSLPNMKFINDKYDYIFLSNIFDYIFNLSSRYINEYDEVMIDYIAVLKRVMEKLKDDGIVFYHYIWYAKDNDYEILYQKYLKDFSQKLVIPSSNHIPFERDNVYIARKKRVLK